jgi:hypothetical protein
VNTPPTTPPTQIALIGATAADGIVRGFTRAGGYSATAVASDCHAARLAIHSMADPNADYLRSG